MRGGSGLGDAIYLNAVARHLVVQGHKVEVCSNWPEVFRFTDVQVSPFRRERINRLAHYSARKGRVGTTQFQDCCDSAQVKNVELKLDWVSGEVNLPKPYICVQLPRAPMGRSDGFGKEILPDCRRIQQAIDAIKGRATVVQIGSGKPLFSFERVDIDLSNKTSVSQMIDVASQAIAFIGYPSFLVPLAEALDKRALLVWSRKGLVSGTQYVRQITPQKVIHKPSCRWVIDNCNEAQIVEEVNAFF